MKRYVARTVALAAILGLASVGRAQDRAPLGPTPAPAPASPPQGGSAPAPVPAPAAPPFAGPAPLIGYPQAYYSPTVPISLHTDQPGMVVEVYASRDRPEQDIPVVRCQTPCVAQLPPASYRVYVPAGEGTLSGSRVVSLRGPSYVTVVPDAESERWVGLGLGIGGLLAIPAGIVLILAEALDDIDCDDFDDPTCGDDDNVDLAVPGALLVLGGLVATPIGWVMFGQSFRPAVEVQPARIVPSTGGIPIKVGGGPRGSAGLRLGVSF